MEAAKWLKGRFTIHFQQLLLLQKFLNAFLRFIEYTERKLNDSEFTVQLYKLSTISGLLLN